MRVLYSIRENQVKMDELEKIVNRLRRDGIIDTKIEGQNMILRTRNYETAISKSGIRQIERRCLSCANMPKNYNIKDYCLKLREMPRGLCRSYKGK